MTVGRHSCYYYCRGCTGDCGQSWRRLYANNLQHESVASFLDEIHDVLVCRAYNAHVANLHDSILTETHATWNKCVSMAQTRHTGGALPWELPQTWTWVNFLKPNPTQPNPPKYKPNPTHNMLYTNPTQPISIYP